MRPAHQKFKRSKLNQAVSAARPSGGPPSAPKKVTGYCKTCGCLVLRHKAKNKPIGTGLEPNATSFWKCMVCDSECAVKVFYVESKE